MIILHSWDESGRYAGPVEWDEIGPLPKRCTAQVPPEADEGMAVYWVGDGWSQFEPPVIDPVVEDRRVTRLAFRNRFTQPELVTLEIAALDDPSAPMPARQGAASIRVMMRLVDTATFIDLDRADTRAGVMQLEAGGLLSEGRALEILDAPIAAEERPA